MSIQPAWLMGTELCSCLGHLQNDCEALAGSLSHVSHGSNARPPPSLSLFPSAYAQANAQAVDKEGVSAWPTNGGKCQFRATAAFK